MKVSAEQNFERVQAQNDALLQGNESLQTENYKLTEALEHAMNCCEQMKSQRNEYSERFGFLSNEMSSLRGLANDIKSQKGQSQRAFNTQKHTANKPSLVDNITSQKTQKGLPPGGAHKKNLSIVRHPEVAYHAYDDISSTTPVHNAGQMTPTMNVLPIINNRNQTLGHASNDDNGIQKLEPIVEEQYR